MVPAQCLDRRLRGVKCILRLGADESVFPIGLVPHWRHFDTLLGEKCKRLKLRFCLLAKAVANAKGKSFQDHHYRSKPPFSATPGSSSN